MSVCPITYQRCATAFADVASGWPLHRHAALAKFYGLTADDARAALRGEPITFRPPPPEPSQTASAQPAFRERGTGRPRLPRSPGVMRIAEAAAWVVDMPIDQLLGTCRRKSHAHPRHAMMLVAFERGFTKGAIARTLDMDHTSIVNGVRQAVRHCAGNPSFAAMVREMHARLTA